MLATVVGYCGGTTPSPTYDAIGDHTEALRVTFDPSRVDEQTLLREFWQEHKPMPQTMTGTQYRSALFFHSDIDRRSASSEVNFTGTARTGADVSLRSIPRFSVVMGGRFGIVVTPRRINASSGVSPEGDGSSEPAGAAAAAAGFFFFDEHAPMATAGRRRRRRGARDD